MIVNKITEGYVKQSFDTETGKFVRQEFVAAGECDYENEVGETVDITLLEVNGEEQYLPFDMIQPRLGKTIKIGISRTLENPCND